MMAAGVAQGVSYCLSPAGRIADTAKPLNHQARPPMSERSKPAALVVIALYSALAGLAAILIGATVPSGVGFAIAALGALLLAAAYGLWTLQPWGRAYAWWLYAACIPLGVLAIFQQMSAGNALFQVLGIAIDIVVLVYLGKPELQRLFGLDAGRLEAYARREPYLKRESS
jgi:uncharacterized membrane protein (DUF2068 family)